MEVKSNTVYMQVGYEFNPLQDEKCPICGKNIYISEYTSDYACEDINCPLGHGARELISKINSVLCMVDN